MPPPLPRRRPRGRSAGHRRGGARCGHMRGGARGRHRRGGPRGDHRRRRLQRCGAEVGGWRCSAEVGCAPRLEVAGVQRSQVKDAEVEKHKWVLFDQATHCRLLEVLCRSRSPSPSSLRQSWRRRWHCCCSCDGLGEAAILWLEGGNGDMITSWRSSNHSLAPSAQALE